MNTERKTLLITGAGGFVGTNLVKQALQRGYFVIAVIHNSDFESRSRTRLDAFSASGLQIESGDLNDGHFVRNVFAKYPIDTVIHAAARLEVPLAEEEKALVGYHNTLTMRANRDATAVLAAQSQESAQCSGRKIHFHYISTMAVFDQGVDASVTEESAKNPVTHYGESKLEGERTLLGKPSLAITITYPPQHIGVFLKESLFTTKMILRAMKGEGLDLRGNGGQKIGLVNVESHVAAIMTAIENNLPPGQTEHYLIGSDTPTTLRDIVGTICEELDKKATDGLIKHPDGLQSFSTLIMDDDSRENEISFLDLDDRKARAKLGSFHQEIELRHQISNMIDEIVAHPDHYPHPTNKFSADLRRGVKIQR